MSFSVRGIVVTLGVVAAVLQFGELVEFTWLVLITLGMAGDGVPDQKVRMIELLPMCTFVGAVVAWRLLFIGGSIMLATAVGYYYYRIGLSQLVFASAVPGVIGMAFGIYYWFIKPRSPQP